MTYVRLMKSCVEADDILRQSITRVELVQLLDHAIARYLNEASRSSKVNTRRDVQNELLSEEVPDVLVSPRPRVVTVPVVASLSVRIPFQNPTIPNPSHSALRGIVPSTRTYQRTIVTVKWIGRFSHGVRIIVGLATKTVAR